MVGIDVVHYSVFEDHDSRMRVVYHDVYSIHVEQELGMEEVVVVHLVLTHSSVDLDVYQELLDHDVSLDSMEECILVNARMLLPQVQPKYVSSTN
jgi:hypothetical protein